MAPKIIIIDHINLKHFHDIHKHLKTLSQIFMKIQNYLKKSENKFRLMELHF